MSGFEIAFRNTVRNSRRSVPSIVAVALGTAAIVLFNGYVSYMIHGMQTGTVRSLGHLQVVRDGYLDFGRGNPGRFSIHNYEKVIAAIRQEAALQSRIAVVTPELDVYGIVGRDGRDESSSFAGEAWNPSERRALGAWDGFDMHMPATRATLNEDQPDSGVMGVGLAQLLDLCGDLKVPHCRALPQIMPSPAERAPGATTPDDLAALAATSMAVRPAPKPGISVDLLAASPTGLPNVMRMTVLRTERQAIRDVDATYVAMPLALGQRLVFGPGVKAASTIIVQLRQTSMMAPAHPILERVVKSIDPGLTVVDFHEVSPIYDQIVNNYRTIFRFIAVLMGLVTMFSVANTITMAVAERTREIGTLRALGFERSAIRMVFLIEGALLGLIGAVSGVAGGLLIARLVNAAGMTWTPPGRSAPIPLRIETVSQHETLIASVLVLTILACLSALRPASRASRLPITKALQHA
ncbi:FtsX-like permease family protein [Nguyenibacter vanlangensis]|uniref:FtsX-like permease family protein n=1 Tax=Nguyenibacter vanlangensis TaxID=1216886 RepID=A0ABZ3D2G3_9PROT